MRTAADRQGLAAELAAEFAESQPELDAWLNRQLPKMPPKAYRWVAEMREVGRSTGEPTANALYSAIADYYQLIANERAEVPLRGAT